MGRLIGARDTWGADPQPSIAATQMDSPLPDRALPRAPPRCYCRIGMPHGHHARDIRSVGCAIITVSDTRTPETDGSGRRIRELLEAEGHRIEYYAVLKDEPPLVRAAIVDVPGAAAAIIVNGGTGVARRDTTYEAIQQLLDKEITGFGELFRMLSYEQIGAAAMLSRATAGVAGDRVVFSVPGSTAAVELAMTQLVLPQLRHIVGLVRGGDG
jgi:molybdenum cofactor biosynthesis protein B